MRHRRWRCDEAIPSNDGDATPTEERLATLEPHKCGCDRYARLFGRNTSGSTVKSGGLLDFRSLIATEGGATSEVCTAPPIKIKVVDH